MAVGSTEKAAKLDLSIDPQLKETIEQAAMLLGQDVGDFAISSLVRSARSVIQEHMVTRLSLRDWELFTALIDDAEAEPNEALRAAAEEYKKTLGLADRSAES